MPANERSGHPWRSAARSTPAAAAAILLLAHRVRELRESHGITQEGLASASGIDGKHVQLLEAGKTNPTVATVAVVASALGVRVDELFRSE